MCRRHRAGEEPSRQLPKLDVAGSSPVSRSRINNLHPSQNLLYYIEAPSRSLLFRRPYDVYVHFGVMERSKRVGSTPLEPA